MFGRLKSLFRLPESMPSRFVPVDELTQFQRDTWYRAPAIALTASKLEALTVFLTRSLQRRWSLIGPLMESGLSEGARFYVVLLEAETESGLLEMFRALADNPIAERRLSRR